MVVGQFLAGGIEAGRATLFASRLNLQGRVERIDAARHLMGQRRSRFWEFMLQIALKLLGAEFFRRASVNRTFDWRLGLALLRDRRVPGRAKCGALALGVCALIVLEIVELPLQLVLWTLLPLVGFAADAALDGIELVAVPLLVASVALPLLAPREVVQQIRAELGGAAPSRVYEAAAARVDRS